MRKPNERRIIALLLILSAAGLYAGWKSFWFLTDDAFIAFRYVSNSILGHGYSWNPAPFRPVEGYTSFLFVVILDVVWRLTGIQPPQSANTLALIFSFFSLVLSVYSVKRLDLNSRLQKYRLVFVALMLTGMLLNTTFLTWSSSGLETSLFNCCFLLWIVIAVFSSHKSNGWRFGITSAAVLVYLTRPDGILVVLSTVLLVLVSLVSDYRRGRLKALAILSIGPFIIPVIHIFWRYLYYGEWLPNTYYAKNVAAWPAAGIRYLASFILEYGIWIWFIVFLILMAVSIRRERRQRKGLTESVVKKLKRQFSINGELPDRWFCSVTVSLTVGIHLGYYTFHVGGDHFEWRVYSHLVPLIFLSFFFFVSKLDWGPGRTLTAVTTLIVFSLPIPWTQYTATKNIQKLEVADTLKVKSSDKLPVVLWWLTKPDDALQDYLLDRLICIKRVEHKIFVEQLMSVFPERRLENPSGAGKFPVGYFTTVGVPGWILPNVYILDGYGLNDYVIARHAPYPRDVRKMAHDRYPPVGYIESFYPNVALRGYRYVQYLKRPSQLELTAKKITFIEQAWEDSIVHGANLPDFIIPGR